MGMVGARVTWGRTTSQWEVVGEIVGGGVNL